MVCAGGGDSREAGRVPDCFFYDCQAKRTAARQATSRHGMPEPSHYCQVGIINSSLAYPGPVPKKLRNNAIQHCRPAHHPIKFAVLHVFAVQLHNAWPHSAVTAFIVNTSSKGVLLRRFS